MQQQSTADDTKVEDCTNGKFNNENQLQTVPVSKDHHLTRHCNPRAWILLHFTGVVIVDVRHVVMRVVADIGVDRRVPHARHVAHQRLDGGEQWGD